MPAHSDSSSGPRSMEFDAINATPLRPPAAHVVAASAPPPRTVAAPVAEQEGMNASAMNQSAGRVERDGDLGASANLSDSGSTVCGPSVDVGAYDGRRRGGFCPRRIPFYMWAILAMALPITVLLVTSAVNLIPVAHDLKLMNDEADLIRHSHDCGEQLMQERGSLGAYLAAPNASSAAELARERRDVDACIRLVLDDLDESAARHGDTFVTVRDRVRRCAADIVGVRGEVDRLVRSPRAQRQFFTDFVSVMSLPITEVQRRIKGRASVKLLEMRLISAVRNHIGLTRGVGNNIVNLNSNVVPADTFDEFDDGYAVAASTYALTHDTVSAELGAKLDTWNRSAVTVAMWTFFRRLSANATQQTRGALRTDWWAVVSRGLDALAVIDAEHLESLTGNRGDLAGEVVTVCITIFVGIVVSAIGAVLLARQQQRLNAHLKRQLEMIQSTHESISAFVPRAFLRTMGYTNITEANVGDCTEVALPMLCAEVNGFAAAARRLGTAALFQWIQGYLNPVTRVVERFHGNVQQLMGDAMFASFKASVDAARCALALHTEVARVAMHRMSEDINSVPLTLTAALHYAVVALGVLGHQRRQNCAMISAGVVDATHMCLAARALYCQTLVSEAMVESLTAKEQARLPMRRIGPVKSPIMAKAIIMHEVFADDKSGLALYKQQTRNVFSAYLQKTLEAAAAQRKAPGSDGRQLPAVVSGAQQALRHGGSSSGSQKRNGRNIQFDLGPTMMRHSATSTAPAPTVPQLDLDDAKPSATVTIFGGQDVDSAQAHSPVQNPLADPEDPYGALRDGVPGLANGQSAYDKDQDTLLGILENSQRRFGVEDRTLGAALRAVSHDGFFALQRITDDSVDRSASARRV